MNDKKGDLFEDLRKKYTSKKFFLSDEDRKSQKEKALNENTENKSLKIFSTIDLPIISLFEDFSEPEFAYTEDKFFYHHILVDGKSKYRPYNYGLNYIEKENVLIELDREKIRINDEIHLNSDLIAFRFNLGRGINCNCYELVFLNKEEKEIKFIYYRNHSQGVQIGPFKREPSDEFYPIWNHLLETVEKFIVPHILRFVIDNIKFGNSYLFGTKPTVQKYGNFTELKVILEGVYLTGKIMFIEKEILVSWKKIKLENDGDYIRVSTALPAIERKLLKKSEWNVMIFPVIKEYFIKFSNTDTMYNKEEAKRILNHGFGSPGETTRVMSNEFLKLRASQSKKDACRKLLEIRASIYSADGIDLIDDALLERILLKADGEFPFVIFADIFASNNISSHNNIKSIIDNLDVLLEVIVDNYNEIVQPMDKIRSFSGLKLKAQEFLNEELGRTLI